MRCGECSQCRSWDLDQKCEVPDAVQIDERDSEMSSLGYGEAQFKHSEMQEEHNYGSACIRSVSGNG